MLLHAASTLVSFFLLSLTLFPALTPATPLLPVTKHSSTLFKPKFANKSGLRICGVDTTHVPKSSLRTIGHTLNLRGGNFSATVDVWFHVIYRDYDEQAGYLPDNKLQDQLAVLNAAFAPAGFQFVLRGVSRTLNPVWFASGGFREDGNDSGRSPIWRELRRGSYRTLNVYFSKVPMLGFCELPKEAATARDLVLDGCAIHFGSVPGGLGGDENEEMDRYRQGKTLVHEAGHWLNLLHTFTDGCHGAGDYVSDTPAQLSPGLGCNRNRDTCPDDPGLDPTWNFMDYSDDECMTGFSQGQIERMQASWSWRAGK